MAIVTPADRPKLVRNRCVIEVFGGVLCVVTLLLDFSVGVRASVIGLSQISSFSLICKFTSNIILARGRNCSKTVIITQERLVYLLNSLTIST